MTVRSRFSWCCSLQIFTLLAMVGPIARDKTPAFAQITPDSTLGDERSVVTPNVIRGKPSDRIDGGATRGINLFHSFREFNVGEGRGAYFTNPDKTENIFSRVTGGSRSDILGVLGVLGNASLFLMNPSGIIFGPNASLDVRGSFVGTTADTIQFGDQGFFNVSAPNFPSSLLTVNPSAFLFNQIQAQPITNQSETGLQVPAGESLLLLGGDVSLNNGILQAPGGRVELGGVAGSGTVGLDVDSNNLRLSFPDGVARADVSLTSGARVDVTAGGGGTIAINARNLDVLEGSRLDAGIRSGLGSPSSQAGDITLDATGAITITNSRIRNVVDSGARGNSGDVLIRASQVGVSDTLVPDLPAFISGGILGPLAEGVRGTGVLVGITKGAVGAGGDLTIEAGQLNVSGVAARIATAIFGRGNSGNLTVETEELVVRDGAQISTSTFGVGNAGDLAVRATDSVELIGESANGSFSSGLFAQVEGKKGRGGNLTIDTQRLSISDGAFVGTATYASGDAGSITIETGQLSLSDGAAVSASTFGQGDAGSLLVQAKDSVFLANTSSIGTRIGPGAVGKGRDIDIQTRSLTLVNASQVNTVVSGSNGKLPGGQGEGGDIRIEATDFIDLSGVNEDGFSSGLFAVTQQGAVGRAGDITVKTGAFRVADGAVVNTQTQNPSPGGKIAINAKTFEATGGGQVLSVTRDQGRAGEITLNVSDSVTLSGSDPTFTERFNQFGRFIVLNEGPASGLFANTDVNSTGSGNSINLMTTNLTLTDGAQISAQSQGTGIAGNLAIQANQQLVATDSDITTAASQSTGGEIAISAEDIRLRGDSDIRTNISTGAGSGGNITVTADSVVAFDDSDILAFARDGQGGDITLDTPAFFGENFQPAPANTNPDTLDGNDRVDVNASGAVAGALTIPDVSFIQNSLTELPDNPVATETLIANSCVAPSNRPGGTFIITGAGGLPVRPGDASASPYPTGTVRTVPSDQSSKPGASRTWQKGNPIVEPQGVYRLASGKLVMSRECSQTR